MKKIIFLLILLIGHFCYSQDMLYLKSGFDVQVKVYEIGEKEIKYKKLEEII